MNYKKLKLNRGNIQKSIEQFIGNEINPIIRTNSNIEIYRYNISSSAIIDVYYNKDNSTSIACVGTNKEEAELVAGDIVEKCNLELPDPTRALYLKNISTSTFNEIINELEAKGNTVTTLPNLTIADKFEVTNIHNESITIHYYTSGALNIQGKGYSVYSDIADILSNKIDLDDFLEAQLASNQVENISSDDIKGAMEKAFSHSYNFIKGEVEYVFSSSFFLTKIENPNLPDYSWMVFPMLRGLEGFIKLLLRKKSIIVNDNFGEVFEGISKNSPIKVVKPNMKAVIGDQVFCDVLVDCYQYLAANRHGLFHVDGIISSTRMLNKEQALEMFGDIIHLIEESYVKVHRNQNATTNV